MTRVLVMSFSDLGSDPRVDRQIDALKSSHEIVAAGLAPPRHAVSEFVETPATKRTLLGNALGLIGLLTRQYERVYWTQPTHITALERLSRLKVDAVVANDINALPIALRLGPPVVFDAHEYAPGQSADVRWWRLLMAPYVRYLGRRYIPQVASMMTVSDAISSAYESDTSVRPVVVTNAPPSAKLTPTRVHEPIRILHHGSAHRGRGLEEMVRLGDFLDERFTLDFVLVEGSQGFRDQLIRMSHGNPRVRFPSPWSMAQLVREANEYDVGLYSLAPTNFNRRFALPNKFFEFIQARLAVAIGPSPEMAALVRQYNCGIVADDFSAPSLADAINGLDASAIAAFKHGSHVAASTLSAERNTGRILDAIDDAIFRQSVPQP